MTDAEALAATIAGASGVIAALSALAAFRSAASAKIAQEAAIDIERRARQRECAKLASELSRECDRAAFYGAAVKRLYRLTFILTDSLQNSRYKALCDYVDRRVQSAKDLVSESAEIFETPEGIASLPREDLDRITISLILALDKARNIVEQLTTEVASQEAQAAQLRELQLNNLPRR